MCAAVKSDHQRRREMPDDLQRQHRVHQQRALDPNTCAAAATKVTWSEN
jgi:hypothetical protein